jgi:hypothetical protein
VEIGSVFSKLAFSTELNNTFHSIKYHLCKKQEHLEHGFPVRTELVFKGILPANQKFHGVVRLFLR